MQLKLLLGIVSVALAATTHHVDVGKSGFTFEPQTLTAVAGDKVIFTLFNDHDVAQSDFDKPCQNTGGFFSGTFVDDDNGGLQFEITINDTKPIYYYCTVAGHCGAGMVGGINVPSSGNTIEKYAAAAKNANEDVRPSAAANGVLVSTGAAASASNSAASGSASGSSSGSASASSASTSPTGTGSGASSSGATAASKTGSSSGSTGGAPIKTGSAMMLAGAGAVAALFL